MKILLVTLDDYPHCGGKSTHISSLIEGLNNKNVDVKVLSKNLIPGYKIKVRKLLVYYNRFINPQRYAYLRRKIELDLFVKLVKKSLKKEKFDCISCQDALSCTAVGRADKQLSKSLTMHTYFGLENSLDNDYINERDKYYIKLLELELECLNYVDNIIAVDDRIKEHISNTLKEKNKQDKCKLYSIINFTNTSVYNDQKVKHDKFNILCVRRLVEKNGVYYAVLAMKYVKENIVLHIYGNGPEEKRIIDLVEKEHLQDKVILHGAIDNSKLPAIYKTCDLVIVPSITVNGLQEATSISAIEAMSCAIPTIASNIGGLSQMIKNDDNGMLFEEKNYKELASIITKLYNDPSKCKTIGANARKYVLKNHSHLVAAEKYLKIFISKVESNEKN